MVIFYKKWKKYNETQLTKNKMDLNIRKMTNHPPQVKGNIKKNEGLAMVQVPCETKNRGWGNHPIFTFSL